jgi:hypothetical protein
VKCISPTVCKAVLPSRPPALAQMECAACPLDERPPKPCGQVTASGGQGVTRTRHALGMTPGLVRITYDRYSIPDRLDCYYQGALVATTGGLVSGSGELSWTYEAQLVASTWCLIVVSAPQSGTGWTYLMNCPA